LSEVIIKEEEEDVTLPPEAEVPIDSSPSQQVETVNTTMAGQPKTRVQPSGDRPELGTTTSSRVCVISTSQPRSGDISSSSRTPADIERDNWNTIGYMVTDQWYGEICSRLGEADTEGFASDKLRRLNRYFGPGSPIAEDAFSVSWSYRQVGYLWLNPPYDTDTVERMLQKIEADKAKAVVVLPHWPSRPWYRTMFRHCRNKYFIPAGETVFQMEDKKVCGPTKWPVWALYVEGDFWSQEDLPQLGDDGTWRSNTSSKRRRLKREYKKKQRRM
jgi:hypothetical protein